MTHIDVNIDDEYKITQKEIIEIDEYTQELIESVLEDNYNNEYEGKIDHDLKMVCYEIRCLQDELECANDKIKSLYTRMKYKDELFEKAKAQNNQYYIENSYLKSKVKGIK